MFRPPSQNTSNQVEVQCDKCDYKCVPGPKINHHKYVRFYKKTYILFWTNAICIVHEEWRVVNPNFLCSINNLKNQYTF